MSKLFEKRVISGREIINPFRTENSKEFLSNNLEHEVKTIIDRLFWIEEESKKLEEENEKLKVFKSNAIYCFKKICQVGLNRRDCAELASNIIDMDNTGELYKKEQGE